MKYNDFQILDDEAYLKISEKFINNKPSSLNQTIQTIYSNLLSCADMCSTINKQYNAKIKHTLSELNINLRRMCDNISAQFPTQQYNATRFNTLNIFSLLEKLISTQQEIFKWAISEEKEFYKNIAKTMFVNLSEIINNLILNLKQSDVIFFKFM